MLIEGEYDCVSLLTGHFDEHNTNEAPEADMLHFSPGADVPHDELTVFLNGAGVEHSLVIREGDGADLRIYAKH